MRMLDGRVAIVTGGGRGIGRSHCLELAAHRAQRCRQRPGRRRARRGGRGRPGGPGVAQIKEAGGTAVADGTSVADWAGTAVELLLSTTSPQSGAVSATDTAGNVYRIDRDQNDSSDGDRTLVLSALNVKAIPAGGQLTLVLPRS